MTSTTPAAHDSAAVSPNSQRPRTAPPSVDVLLVEDDEALCKLISGALRARDLVIDIAGNSTEAKRLLARNIYKVALVDLVLRDGSGADVVDFIRGTSVTVHVVVIATPAPESLKQLDRLMVKTVFFKPVDIERLAAYVGTLTK